MELADRLAPLEINKRPGGTLTSRGGGGQFWARASPSLDWEVGWDERRGSDPPRDPTPLKGQRRPIGHQAVALKWKNILDQSRMTLRTLQRCDWNYEISSFAQFKYIKRSSYAWGARASEHFLVYGAQKRNFVEEYHQRCQTINGGQKNHFVPKQVFLPPLPPKNIASC